MSGASIDIFQAIAHPTRRALLDALQPGELAVRDLATRFSSSRPAISQHLRILLEAGLVSERRTGRENLYHLEAAPLSAIEDWVSHYEKFWAGRLLALRAVLDELPGEQP
jgi:DNA-binding transcriptional ArsR family regulator